VQPVQLELDSNVRRSSHNTALFGGSPFRLIRLSPSGAAVLDAWLAGKPTNMSAAQVTLRQRLLNAGMVHPRLAPVEALPSLAVVVPVFNDVAGLDSLLTELRRELADVRLVVVDDGSSNKHEVADVASLHRAELLDHVVNRGPAAARNTGWRHVADAELVVFIDADVSCPPGSLRLLLAHFTDAEVTAAAPRVAAQPGHSALDRFESVRSPLDLGPHPAVVRPGSKISYVPSAALAVRTAGLVETQGFDEAMRLGEDVDFIWRLIGQNHVVRYEPRALLHHRNRSSTAALLRQRFGYGTSAASLAQRHPGAVAPVDLPLEIFGVWCAALFAGPVGRLVSVVGTLNGSRRLYGLLQDKVDEPLPKVAQLTARGHAHAATWLASAVRRAWAPVFMLSRRGRRILAAAHVVASLVDWVTKRPAVDPASFMALAAADDSAYCAGVWRGVLRQRSLAALLPNLRRERAGD